VFETSADGTIPSLHVASAGYAASTMAALWLLARPAAVGRLLLLCAVLAVALFLKMPRLPNHGFFDFVVALTILFAALLTGWRRRALPDGAALYAAFAPAVRWSVVVMYGWAVVHKLNADFFDLEVSCGPRQLDEVRRYLRHLPAGPVMQAFGIYGTLVVETAIPLLLVFRRTRYAGIALALGFHYVLGAGYARFSAMLVAMLTLFVGADLIDPVREAVRRRVSAHRLRRLRAAGVGLAAVGYGLIIAGNRAAQTPAITLHAVTQAWFVYGVLAAALFAAACGLRRRLVADDRHPWRFTHPALAVVPVLMLVNGLTPHIGVKNTQAFAMYSNLRTEGGVSNHLFLPSALQVFDQERDLVTIVSSSDRVLALLARRQWHGSNYFYSYIAGNQDLDPADAPSWQVPFASLRLRVSDLARQGVRGVRVTYDRGGRRYTTENAERDPTLARASLLERKLLFLRAVPMTEKSLCMW
jgi:hypothetical protein